MAEERRKKQGGYKSYLLFFSLQCNLEKPWGSLNYAQLSTALQGKSCTWKVPQQKVDMAPLSRIRPGGDETLSPMMTHLGKKKLMWETLHYVCVCTHTHVFCSMQ